MKPAEARAALQALLDNPPPPQKFAHPDVLCLGGKGLPPSTWVPSIESRIRWFREFGHWYFQDGRPNLAYYPGTSKEFLEDGGDYETPHHAKYPCTMTESEMEDAQERSSQCQSKCA